MAVAPVEIEIDGLCKRFGAAPVTDYALGAAIRHDEFVALLGRSGCGKSTLLNLVAGLLEPSAGEVRVKGRRVAGPGEGKDMVFQQHAPFPWLLVLTRWQSIAAISGFAGSTVVVEPGAIAALDYSDATVRDYEVFEEVLLQ